MILSKKAISSSWAIILLCVLLGLLVLMIAAEKTGLLSP